MKLTNKHNLAPEFVKAVSAREKKYSKGDADYSVTELLNSPRQVHLNRRHYDDLEVDVHDLLRSWEGNLIHDAVEMDLPRVTGKFFIEDNPVTISGCTDYYKDRVFKDYKTTSVWKIIYGSDIEKWTAQLNMYAVLYKDVLGWETDKLIVEAYLTDWQRSKAKFEKDYPKLKQFPIEIELWPYEKSIDFIVGRLNTIHPHVRSIDDALPQCTVDEMWEKPTKFAAMKKGNKKASRVCDSVEEIRSWIEFKGRDPDDFDVVERPGVRTKCADWCPANKFCSQWNEYNAKLGG